MNRNPVLKKAGVVDAGGKGFWLSCPVCSLACWEAMAQSERRNPPPSRRRILPDFDSQDTTFAFDTVYIVRKKDSDVDLNPLRDYLNSIGDSLVIGEDDESFKVHVHTNIPGQALTESQKYGTLELAKIENMRTQQEALAAGREAQSTDDLEQVEAELESMESGEAGRTAYRPNEKRYGFVAVCAGDGLEAVFRGSGGGRHGVRRPDHESRHRRGSVEGHRRHPAETVFVLPNNKNIIMAAQQCIPLSETKKVVVIETKTVPQGIAAMMAVDLGGR